MRRGFFAPFFTAVLLVGGCNNNPIAAEQQALLKRVDKSVDDLRPIGPDTNGSVCDDLYLRKLYYDEICVSHQRMGESRIASSSDTRIAVRMLLLPTFGRPASARLELASSSKGTVTVRQLSRSVLRENLLLQSLMQSPEITSNSPFAEDVRVTFDQATDLDSADIEKILRGLNQAKLWGMEFDPYQSGWRYHFRRLLGDNLSSTLLQLVGLGTVIECFDGTAWVMEALEADRWGAVMRICRPGGEGKGRPPLPLDDLGNTMIQIARIKFPDLDLTARAERSGATP